MKEHVIETVQVSGRDGAMPQYEYPYPDFARDLDAVLPSPNSVALDEMQRMLAVRRYVRATYTNDVDLVQRGAALGLAWRYICQNMTEFDIGKVAVRGKEHCIISEELLQAVHALVCRAALDTSNLPSPAEVRALAENYLHEKEHPKHETEAKSQA